MAKAFKNCTLQAWPAAFGLLNTNDGWKKRLWCSVTKQKLVEIPRIEEIAFIVILTVHYFMTRYLDTQPSLKVLPRHTYARMSLYSPNENYRRDCKAPHSVSVPLATLNDPEPVPDDRPSLSTPKTIPHAASVPIKLWTGARKRIVPRNFPIHIEGVFE